MSNKDEYNGEYENDPEIQRINRKEFTKEELDLKEAFIEIDQQRKKSKKVKWLSFLLGWMRKVRI